MKRTLLSLVLTLALGVVWAQGPNGSANYYQGADGLKGKALKTKLSSIISSGVTVISYKGLYDAYKKTDTRSDGYVRDWYSNITNYRHGIDNKGNYSKEGDMYNREHSVPQSWFGDGNIKSDIVHVLPTDGYVNNRRGNLPLGEVNNATYQSANGYSKLGSCRTSGYSGTVFEPNDEIKGDMARIYFYMITRYEGSCGSWGNSVFTSQYPGLTQWTLDMMMRWSKDDPVDDREVERNNAVYETQHNRNPFVDYPGLEEYTWGTKMNEPFSYDNYAGAEVDPNFVHEPIFSHPGGTFVLSVDVTITTNTADADIYYTLDGSDATPGATLYTGPITITETTTLKAVAVKDGNVSHQTSAKFTIVDEEPVTPVNDGDVVFYESFDGCNGAGGGGDNWSDASGTFEADNDGWVSDGPFAGDQCARFGSGSKSGVVTTPEFTLTTATSTLSFMAAPYNVDATSLKLEVVGNGVTLSESELTMVNKEWTSYTITLTGTGTIRLKFTPAKRFFLDEVLVTANSNDPTGIAPTYRSPITTHHYYTLDGRMLQGIPTQKGVYIYKGKKVVVRD
ncbi:MAG: endonuclease [Prevotella sp.]|nr:endonuclease [Prevotella sp.]